MIPQTEAFLRNDIANVLKSLAQANERSRFACESNGLYFDGFSSALCAVAIAFGIANPDGGKLALVRVWSADECEEVAPGEYQPKAANTQAADWLQSREDER